MTREEWDRHLEEARGRIRTYGLSFRVDKKFLEQVAIFETEFLHSPRETCEQPPAKGLLNS